MLIFSACLAAAASENSSFDLWPELLQCFYEKLGSGHLPSLQKLAGFLYYESQNLLNSSKGKLDANFFTF